MNQNRLYLVIGVLAAALVALSIYVWQEQSKPKGIELRVGQDGISIQEN